MFRAAVRAGLTEAMSSGIIRLALALLDGSAGPDHRYMGRISKCGDRELRTALVESAFVLLTVTRRKSALKTWGLNLAKRRGIQKAAIAVARRMSAILHRMWIDGTSFRWSEPEAVAA